MPAGNASRAYGVANPSFTGTYTGATNGDSFTVSGSSVATTSSPVGTYAIVPVAMPSDREPYNIDALWARMAMEIDEAKLVQLDRLRIGRDHLDLRELGYIIATSVQTATARSILREAA